MEKEDQVAILKKRFNQNMARHPATTWALVEEALLNNEKLFSSILKMEETQGEPDVVRFSHLPGELYYVDCSSESPKGRRSICYDQAALNKRKKNKRKKVNSFIHSHLVLFHDELYSLNSQHQGFRNMLQMHQPLHPKLHEHGHFGQ